MTNVTTLASRRAAVSVQSPAQNPTTQATSASLAAGADSQTIERQQAIENALSTALYFIRQPYSITMLRGATGRANRALSLLKNACAEAQIGGAA